MDITHTIYLNDGTRVSLLKDDTFYDLLREKLGSDAANYYKERLESCRQAGYDECDIDWMVEG